MYCTIQYSALPSITITITSRSVKLETPPKYTISLAQCMVHHIVLLPFHGTYPTTDRIHQQRVRRIHSHDLIVWRSSKKNVSSTVSCSFPVVTLVCIRATFTAKTIPTATDKFIASESKSQHGNTKITLCQGIICRVIQLCW